MILSIVSEPIALGKTNAVYSKSDDIFVSFKPELEVKIFAKTEDDKYLDIEVVINRFVTYFIFVLNLISGQRKARVRSQIARNRSAYIS